MLRTAVPRLAVNPAPLTGRSLINTTVSPCSNRIPLLSKCSTTGKISCARAKTSGSIIIFSRASDAHISSISPSRRQTAICTAGVTDHAAPSKHRQWASGALSLWQVSHNNTWSSGGTSTLVNPATVPQNSQTPPARSINSSQRITLPLESLDVTSPQTLKEQESQENNFQCQCGNHLPAIA